MKIIEKIFNFLVSLRLNSCMKDKYLIQKIIHIEEDFIVTGIKFQKVLVQMKDGSEKVVTMPSLGDWDDTVR